MTRQTSSITRMTEKQNFPLLTFPRVLKPATTVYPFCDLEGKNSLCAFNNWQEVGKRGRLNLLFTACFSPHLFFFKAMLLILKTNKGVFFSSFSSLFIVLFSFPHCVNIHLAQENVLHKVLIVADWLEGVTHLSLPLCPFNTTATATPLHLSGA